MKKGQAIRMAFVSNYINHHQIPFCNVMHRLLEGDFTFIQTEPMEEERVRMGWHEGDRPAYVRCFYEEEAYCKRLILDCDIVLFGGTEEESYITPRLEAGRPVIRYSERLYRTGQWKAVSPRGLMKKYRDHTRYRRAPVYLLCSGAYVPSDFHIVRAYPGKMYCWGYFPETRHYDIDRLLEEKGYGEEKIPSLLWAARLIDLKHPELALETAAYLRDKKLDFHMDIIGDGELRTRMEALAEEYGLEGHVTFLGYRSPEEVRRAMEKADIFLFTSDRREGWGAVANEAMNSACALVAGHMIGSAPWLIRQGENGLIYEDGKKRQLFFLTESLVKDRIYCRQLGRSAYRTITEDWNAENAAGLLLKRIRNILGQENGESGFEAGGQEPGQTGGCIPCSPAPVLTEHKARKMFRAFPVGGSGTRRGDS